MQNHKFRVKTYYEHNCTCNPVPDDMTYKKRLQNVNIFISSGSCKQTLRKEKSKWPVNFQLAALLFLPVSLAGQTFWRTVFELWKWRRHWKAQRIITKYFDEANTKLCEQLSLNEQLFCPGLFRHLTCDVDDSVLLVTGHMADHNTLWLTLPYLITAQFSVLHFFSDELPNDYI